MFGTLLFAALTLTHNPMPLPSFAFAGRVTDYAHIGYDADQQVEVRVKAKDGSLLAKSLTGTSGRTGYNFVVEVPVSDTPANGTVAPGTPVTIEFVDPDGVVYQGLVAAGDAVVGRPGEVKRLTVVLATDADHDGVADEYVEALAFLMWKNGKTVYDANADWDGDGVSNYREYVAGTNPFDGTDRFSIRQMATDAGFEDYFKFTFLANQGRSYTVETTTELEKGDSWRRTSFRDPQGVDRTHVRTGGTETGYRTIYVLKDGVKRFWKLNVE